MAENFEGGHDFASSFLRGWNIKIFSDKIKFGIRMNPDLMGLVLSGTGGVYLNLWIKDKNEYGKIPKKEMPKLPEIYITEDISYLGLPKLGLMRKFDMTQLVKIQALNLGETPRFLFGNYPPNVITLKTSWLPKYGTVISSKKLQNLRKLTLSGDIELKMSMISKSIKKNIRHVFDEDNRLPSLEEIEFSDGFSLPGIYFETILKKMNVGNDFIGNIYVKTESFEAGPYFTGENLHAKFGVYKVDNIPDVQNPDDYDENRDPLNSIHKFSKKRLKYLTLRNPNFAQYSAYFLKKYPNLEFLQLGDEVFLDKR